MRQIIQLSTALASDFPGELTESTYALCDDGTVWEMVRKNRGRGQVITWEEIPTLDMSMAKSIQETMCEEVV